MSGRPLRVLAVGNLNIDVVMFVSRNPLPGENIVAEDYWLGLGGAATNYAVAVARLGHKVSLIALASWLAVRLGFLEVLSREGVDVSHVRVSEGDPSLASIIVSREENARTIISYRGLASSLSHEMIPRSGDHAHFASVNPRVVLGYVDSKPELSISYDPGGEIRREKELVLKALRSVDTVMMTRHEIEILAGMVSLEDACRFMDGSTRLQHIVVKMGEKGAAVLTRENSYHVDSPRVEVIDTTGAGDAFDAGFTIGLLEEGDVEWALRLGVAMGALKVRLKGSSVMPDRASAEKLAESLTSRKLGFKCS